MMRLKLWVRDGLSLLFWVGRRLTGRSSPPGVRILVYHAIANVPPQQDRWRMSVSPELFAAHVRWLRDHDYTFVSLREAFEIIRGTRPMPSRAVALTFDDGFHDTLTSAYPVLRRARIPATAFVVPKYLDSPEPFPWLDGPGSFGRPLTWQELARLTGERLMSVGAHGWTHRCLSDLSHHDQDQEVRQCKTALEEKLHQPVTWFAYPYGFRGSFSEETVSCLQQAGYEAACANVMGTNRAGDSPWTLKRTRVGWEDALWRFRLKMAGGYDWVDRWSSRRIHTRR